MATARILVTGATGRVGGALLPLLKRAGATVSALVRDPKRAAHLKAQGIELRQGDLADPASLGEGARRHRQGVPRDPRQPRAGRLGKELHRRRGRRRRRPHRQAVGAIGRPRAAAQLRQISPRGRDRARAVGRAVHRAAPVLLHAVGAAVRRRHQEEGQVHRADQGRACRHGRFARRRRGRRLLPRRRQPEGQGLYPDRAARRSTSTRSPRSSARRADAMSVSRRCPRSSRASPCPARPACRAGTPIW